jgi:chromosome segregation ATPase
MLVKVPALDEQIASLQEQLLQARRSSDSLSEELESPSNKQRWRRLEGKIPDKEELVAKINMLEERLNDKKEHLLEKELILEEVSSLAGRLRQQAAEGRADTLELAKRVNDYQARIRGTTRSMMATVSELSMYQASSMKLAAEREDLEGEVGPAPGAALYHTAIPRTLEVLEPSNTRTLRLLRSRPRIFVLGPSSLRPWTPNPYQQ